MILPILLFLALPTNTPIEVSPDGTLSNLYFHNSNFTADGKYLIFSKDAQIHKFELATQKVTPLTNEPGVAAQAAMPDRFRANRVLYARGRELWAVDVETGGKRKIGEGPAHARGISQPSVSHDGKSVAVSFKSGEKSWEIGLISLETGLYRKVLEQGFPIGHVQHSYVEPLIFYVWETGGYAPQRTWLVNADGTGNRPFYAATDHKAWLTPLKEWITHEAWVPGSRDMTMILDKLGILRVTPDGPARIITRGNYWHAHATADGKQLIADDFDGRLWLIDGATGEARLLATNLRHGSGPHLHASIDPTGTWVVTNTVRNGRSSVAVIRLR
jgi:Tol biopolymer transport system component